MLLNVVLAFFHVQYRGWTTPIERTCGVHRGIYLNTILQDDLDVSEYIGSGRVKEIVCRVHGVLELLPLIAVQWHDGSVDGR